MGQYHLTVNLDRREFLMPHTLGDGLKLIEQTTNPDPGLMTALHILLACSNGRGGGDLSNHPLVGRWTGDRIAVVGDYAEQPDIPGCDASAIYAQCRTSYRYFEFECTKATHVDTDEVFYLPHDWASGRWQRADQALHRSTDEGILARNTQTTNTRFIDPDTPVALLGTEYGQWCDISPTMARFIESEFAGRYRGSGWRNWQYQRCA